MTKKIGIIFYIEDDKKRKYYPDFYIKSENKIIEVKSVYTYNKELTKNLLKQQTVLDMGLNFEFIILDKEIYLSWKKNKTKITKLNITNE